MIVRWGSLLTTAKSEGHETCPLVWHECKFRQSIQIVCGNFCGVDHHMQRIMRTERWTIRISVFPKDLQGFNQVVHVISFPYRPVVCISL
jgi:hypothetical protein